MPIEEVLIRAFMMDVTILRVTLGLLIPSVNITTLKARVLASIPVSTEQFGMGRTFYTQMYSGIRLICPVEPTTLTRQLVYMIDQPTDYGELTTSRSTHQQTV